MHIKDSSPLGQIVLIPSPLFEQEIAHIPQMVIDEVSNIQYWFVENIRTTRRVLKLYNKNIIIDDLHFEEMNQQHAPNLKVLTQWLQAGYKVGVMSEAGIPGIADPGSVIVAKAHEMGATITPNTGPNSIMLALMASGFNGQQFTFHGYLPIDNAPKIKAIKNMDLSAKNSHTHIFIETPYRNNQLLASLLQTLSNETKLCIASSITAPNQLIKILKIKEWKALNVLPDLHKKPTIFLIGI